MKKFLLLTAFMLIYLCSYSQKLTVRNDTPFTISVAGFEGDTGCFDSSGSVQVAPGQIGYITTSNYNDFEWKSIRASDVPNGLAGPQYVVVDNSSCGTGCVSEVEIGLQATWNTCFEVTIDDI